MKRMKRLIYLLLLVPFLGYGQSIKEIPRGAINNSRATARINEGIIQTNTNTTDIATNAAAISVNEDSIASYDTRITAAASTGSSTNIDPDSITIETIDGSSVAVFFSGTDSIMPYIPYAYRSSGALESREITAEKETLVLTDQSKFIYMNRATADTLLIPANASVAFPVDTEITLLQWGAGTTSIGSATSDVLINGAAADTVDISAQYKPVTLKKKATNTWSIFGGL